MVKYALITITLITTFALVRCTVKSTGKWKSDVIQLEISYDDNWELILPYLDSESKTLVGVKDPSDNCSLTIKVTNDVSKDELSDKTYLSSTKEQMLNISPENVLIAEDKISFKDSEYNRLIFKMKTKHGEMIHTIYIHRDGTKIKGVQFTYPKAMVENPKTQVPNKLNVILEKLKF